MNPSTGQWRTLARTASVRLYLNIGLGTTNLGTAGLGLLGTIVGSLLPISVQLPLALQVAPGTAWLQSTDCATTTAASTAVVGVLPGLANLCIGTPLGLNANQAFGCNSATIVSILNLITIQANIQAIATLPQSSAATLTFNGITGDSDDYQTVNSNAVGSVLGNAVQSLAQGLNSPNGLTVTILGLPLALGAQGLGSILSALNPLLTPLYSTLDALVVPLLSLLGAQIGSATVHNEALTCRASQTVY